MLGSDNVADEQTRSGVLVHIDDYRKRGLGRNPPQLLAYCLGSGAIAITVATALSFAASGIAQVAVWSTVIGAVSVVAGLAYESRLLRVVCSAWRVALRQRAGA
jgi:hypothetical protein